MADGNTLAPADAEGTGDTAILAEAREYLRLCIAADDQNRTAALDDLTFISGEQWDPRDRQQRAVSGRPCLTINKLPTFLHQVTNDQRQNKMGAKIHPVGDDDAEKAKIVQGIVRHIEFASNASVATGTAVNSAATIGYGFYRLITRYCEEDSFDQEIAFKRIRNAFTVYLDPGVQELDGSDQMRCMISEKMPRAEFKRKFPKANASGAMGVPAGTGDKTLADWLGEDYVRVSEFYKVELFPAWLVMTDQGPMYEDEMEKADPPPNVLMKNGKPMRRKSEKRKVMWRLLTAVDVLETVEIPCRWIPVFPVFGDELDIDGKVIRSGLVRHAKDPARMYNYWMPGSLETPVPTPAGWSTIGALKVGDTVFADDGSQTAVVGKSPVYINRDCYRVTFGDGSSVVCDAQHPWVVEERGKRSSSGFAWTSRKLRTDELDPKRHCIKVAGPLEAPDAALPLDPYVLGVWLGDGSKSSSVISSSLEDIEDMRLRIALRGFDVAPARELQRSPCFSVLGLVPMLKAAGVFENKHIPQEYLRASVAQRLELLRGLMDTDGNAHRSGQCVFTQADEVFAGQFRELVVSLGMKTGAHRRQARVSMLANGHTISSGGSTQVAFTPGAGVEVFALPRKLAMQKLERKRMPRRHQHKIASVERVESVPVQCIAIEAPSHLFLWGSSMIPTHNTAATEEVALRTKTPYIGAEGQFEGHEDTWAAANTTSFPYLEYKPVTLDGTLAPMPSRQPMGDVPTGTITMARTASDDIKATTGLYDSSLGARGTATSGIQERAQQLQGDTANYHYQDNSQITYRHAIKCLIDMVPKIYDGARIVKIMGEDEKITSQAINGYAEDAVDITNAEYDYTIGVGPAYSTARQEATDALIALGKNWPKLMDVAGDKVVGNMDFHGSEDVAERIKRTIPPEILGEQEKEGPEGPMVMTPQGPVTLEQAGQMIGQLSQDAEMLTVELEKANKGIPKAQIDAQARVQVAEINAASKAADTETAYLSAMDVAELRGLVELLKAQIQPPQQLISDAAVRGTTNEALI